MLKQRARSAIGSYSLFPEGHKYGPKREEDEDELDAKNEEKVPESSPSKDEDEKKKERSQGSKIAGALAAGLGKYAEYQQKRR